MSKPIAEFIDADSSGKSGDSRLDAGAIGSESRIDPAKQYDFESTPLNFPEPRTSSIADTGTNVDNGDGDVRRNRHGRIDGRTRAARTARSGTQTTASQRNLADDLSIKDLLIGIHLMGAKFFDADYWELETEEATKLAASIEKVSRYYNTTFDPKKVAIVELAIVAGGIYGPRMLTSFAGASLKKKTKLEVVPIQDKKEAKPNGVFHPPTPHADNPFSPSSLNPEPPFESTNS